MRRYVSQLFVFAIGIGVGALLMQPGEAQTNTLPGFRLNHVGIYTKDYNESMKFYTQTMGFKEAFTIKDKDGNPTLTYLQINRDQFLELAPATADRPAGLSHIGILPDDLSKTVVGLRQRGVKIDDPRTGATKTSITSALDPTNVRLELLDFLPGSLPRQAIDNWK